MNTATRILRSILRTVEPEWVIEYLINFILDYVGDKPDEVIKEVDPHLIRLRDALIEKYPIDE